MYPLPEFRGRPPWYCGVRPPRAGGCPGQPPGVRAGPAGLLAAGLLAAGLLAAGLPDRGPVPAEQAVSWLPGPRVPGTAPPG